MRFLELWVDKEITLFFGEDRMKVKGILKAADEMFIYLLDADNEINALQLRDVKHIRLKCDKAG